MSVRNIITNMNVETFSCLGECKLVAQKWLSENAEDSDLKQENFRFSFFELNSLETTENLLNDILQKVTENRNLLIGILAELLYTFYDAKAIIDMLIEEITFYAENVGSLYSHVDNVVFDLDVELRLQELAIFGRILCPAIIANGILSVKVTNEKCFPFFSILKQIITGKGDVPQLELKRKKSRNLLDVALIKEFSEEHYCPMIIFDDCDLDSAVHAIISNAWSYQGRALWTPTHVYIQEGIFVEAIPNIKSMTLRFIKSNSFYFEHHENSQENKAADDSVGNLEVFKPSPKYPHQFFIGWDPREFSDKKEYNPFVLGLSILPFRTEEEAIALINNSQYACAASIWTERLSRAISISKKLDMSTIWLNNHGLLKPQTPFESQKKTKIPFNGLRLLNFLQMPKKKVMVACDKLTKTANNVDLICTSMNEAVNEAIQASVVLTKMENKRIKYLLQPLSEIIDSAVLDIKVNVEHNILNFEKLKMDCICWKESHKVVMVEVLDLKDSTMMNLVWLIYSSLLLRNSVIVIVSPEDIDTIVKFNVLSFPRLPARSIIFVSKDVYKPLDVINQTVIQKQILLHDYDTIAVFRNEIGYHTKIPPASLCVPSLMEALLVGMKAIWFQY